MCLLYMFQFAFLQFIQSDSSGPVCPICLEAYFFDVKHFNSLNVQSTSHLQGDSRILELAKYYGATWSIFHPIRQVCLSNSFCVKDMVFFFLERSGNYTALSKELLLCYHSQTFLITRGDSLVVQSAHPVLRLFNCLLECPTILEPDYGVLDCRRRSPLRTFAACPGTNCAHLSSGLLFAYSTYLQYNI